MDNIEMFTQMVNSQNDLNKLTIGKNWRYEAYGDKLIDWNKAIRIELAEYEDSFDWKWWKSGIDNIANAKMELIDVLHFAISRSLTENSFKAELIEILCDSYDKSFKDVEVKELYTNSENFYQKLFGMFDKHDMKIESVYRLYMMKNLLNIFRQKNGYTEGTYDKVFTSHHESITYEGEDNKILVSCSLGLEPLEGIKIFSKIYEKRNKNENL